MTWEGLSPPYATIVADPPWEIQARAGVGGRRRNPTRVSYSFMPLDDILALPVGDLAAPDAWLLLWVTAKLNRRGVGVQVAQAWGFRDVGEFVWEKPNAGLGRFPRPAHEILLVCARGNPSYTGPLNVRSVQRHPQVYGKGNSGKQHSTKPAGFLDQIQSGCPGPYVELFARQPRLGWDSWGWGYEQAAGA